MTSYMKGGFQGLLNSCREQAELANPKDMSASLAYPSPRILSPSVTTATLTCKNGWCIFIQGCAPFDHNGYLDLQGGMVHVCLRVSTSSHTGCLDLHGWVEHIGMLDNMLFVHLGILAQ
eukprot:1156329-Pelagomonas_calceolata.AAC.5